MTAARASDGVALDWSETGAGPTVLLAPYWSMHPSVFDGLEADLAGDHRVIRYAERGTGASERVGPFDMATGTDDLREICRAAGGVDVAVCLVDGSNRTVRVAHSDPDLLGHVVCMGSAPYGAGALREAESLISSEVVVSAFLRQIETDYRGAVRAALSGANAAMTEEEIRDRVQMQIEYADAEGAAARAREWAHDEGAAEPGARIGERLHICLSHAMGGPGSWFPSADDLEKVATAAFPKAGITWTSNGIVTAPGELAAVIRSITRP